MTQPSLSSYKNGRILTMSVKKPQNREIERRGRRLKNAALGWQRQKINDVEVREEDHDIFSKKHISHKIVKAS